MTEPKKRGRPKKVVAPEEPTNPDCEQATKGFVKCLVRKYDKTHTHEQRGSGGDWSCFGAIAFSLAWLVLGTLRFDGVYLWMTGIAAIVLWASTLDHHSVTESRTCPSTGDGLFDEPPTYLRKYCPPSPLELYNAECERKRKKGCE